MKLYDVRYPFEIDRLRGKDSALYTSLKAATKDAKDLFLARDMDEESSEYGEAVVELATLGRMTPSLICEIINSEGEGWCRSSREIGKIVWDGRRAQFEATVEDLS